MRINKLKIKRSDFSLRNEKLYLLDFIKSPNTFKTWSNRILKVNLLDESDFISDLSPIKQKTAYGMQLLFFKRLQFFYGNVPKRNIVNLCKLTYKLTYGQELNLLLLMESRLQHVVYKMNFSSTVIHAQQLIAHKHFKVNDKEVHTPNYLVRPGDIISVKTRLGKLKPTFIESLMLRIHRNTFYYNTDHLLVNYKIFKGIVVNINQNAYNTAYITSLMTYLNPKDVVQFCMR